MVSAAPRPTLLVPDFESNPNLDDPFYPYRDNDSTGPAPAKAAARSIDDSSEPWINNDDAAAAAAVTGQQKRKVYSSEDIVAEDESDGSLLMNDGKIFKEGRPWGGWGGDKVKRDGETDAGVDGNEGLEKRKVYSSEDIVAEDESDGSLLMNDGKIFKEGRPWGGWGSGDKVKRKVYSSEDIVAEDESDGSLLMNDGKIFKEGRPWGGWGSGDKVKRDQDAAVDGEVVEKRKVYSSEDIVAEDESDGSLLMNDGKIFKEGRPWGGWGSGDKIKRDEDL